MPSRIDGPLKVTGQAKYGADHVIPGTVHDYVVLSTIANGEVTAVDVAEAKGAPGVLAVYTPLDPLVMEPVEVPILGGKARVPLKDKEVFHYGQPIGFVVAETFEQARDAAMAIGVSYDERPPVTSLLDGLDTAETVTVPVLNAEPEITVLAEGVESIEDALAASPVVVTGTYSTATQNHVAMEPHSAVAVWDAGTLTVYTGNQAGMLSAARAPVPTDSAHM